MSVEAISWALKQRLGQPSAKLLLIAMANCADPRDFRLSASIDYLSDATSMDRKTVILGIRRLLECGLIEATGLTAGQTGRMPVYRLAIDAQSTNGPENGTINAHQQPLISPETGLFDRVNGPKNGTITGHPGEPRERGTIGGEGEEGSNDPHAKTESKEPKESRKEGAGRKPSARAEPANKLRTLPDWITFVRANGERAIPAEDPVYRLADSLGLDPEMVRVQWHHFRATYTEERDRKTYTDWRKVFRNSIRSNWFHLWTVDKVSMKVIWTSAGLQARRLFQLEQQAQTAPTDQQPQLQPA